jgi:surface polysaccharide O-acyltransferase-like enzyme
MTTMDNRPQNHKVRELDCRAKNTLPALSGAKLYSIEIARVVGILVVVLLHTVGLAVAEVHGTWLYTIISPLARFVVPLFFMISGLVLGLHHRDPGYRLDAKRFWRRRLYGLVVPFFAWNIVYMVVLGASQGSLAFDGQTLFNLTTGYVHLYYVFVLLQFLLLYTLLANHISRRLVLICLFLSAFSSIAFYAISAELLWTVGADQHAFEWRYGKLFFAWAALFFWGLWLGHCPAALEWLRKVQGWLLLLAICTYVPYLVMERVQFQQFGAYARDYFLLSGLPFQFIAATWLLTFLYGLEDRIRASRTMSRLAGYGRYVFGIYVAHIAVLVILVFLWDRFMPTLPAALEFLAIATLTLLLTIGFLRPCYLRPFRILGVVLLGARGTPRRP